MSIEYSSEKKSLFPLPPPTAPHRPRTPSPARFLPFRVISLPPFVISPSSILIDQTGLGDLYQAELRNKDDSREMKTAMSKLRSICHRRCAKSSSNYRVISLRKGGVNYLSWEFNERNERCLVVRCFSRLKLLLMSELR